MPLDNSFERSVHFVGRRTQAGDTLIGGTAFLVSIPSTQHESASYKFLVTAGHVVSYTPTVVIRSPTQAGSSVDSEIGGWVTHPQYDVSVAPAVLPRVNAHYQPVPLGSFVDAPDWVDAAGWEGEPFVPKLGDKVYFAGLLPGITSMVEGRVPIVRSGTIARLWQEGFPVADQWNKIVDMTVHLIDGSAYGGLSGAPCLVEHARAYIESPEAGTVRVGTRYRIGLLGLIGGHLDELRPLVEDGEEELRRRARHNRGIAHVIPAEHIRETLNLDEVKEAMATMDRLFTQYKGRGGARREE